MVKATLGWMRWSGVATLVVGLPSKWYHETATLRMVRRGLVERLLQKLVIGHVRLWWYQIKRLLLGCLRLSRCAREMSYQRLALLAPLIHNMYCWKELYVHLPVCSDVMYTALLGMLPAGELIAMGYIMTGKLVLPIIRGSIATRRCCWLSWRLPIPYCPFPNRPWPWESGELEWTSFDRSLKLGDESTSSLEFPWTKLSTRALVSKSIWVARSLENRPLSCWDVELGDPFNGDDTPQVLVNTKFMRSAGWSMVTLGDSEDGAGEES